ncbi:efflux transporter outer membrane subunit [soil metagenome]
MSRITLSAVVALGSVVAACAAGPTYRTPDTPARVAPADFAETTAATAFAPPPPRWWKLYDSPALDALVEKALAANTDLRQADANLRLARGVLSEIRGERLPSTELTGGASFGRRSGSSASSGAGSTAGGTTTGSGTSGSSGGTTSGTTGSTSAPSIRATYTYGFTVAYDLDLFGRLRRGIEAARADVGAREAALDLARTQVAAETTRAYVQACAYGLQADVARQSLQLVTDTYDITVRQRDLGAGTDFDVARARTLVEQTRAPVPQFEASRRSALYALAVLTGEPPERVPQAAAACRAPPTLVQPLPVGDGRSLLARRPDVREAERTLAASVARIGVRTADLYPTITLGGNVAGFGTGLSTLTSDRGLTFGIGPMLSWSFPNVVLARARIGQAQATAQGSLAAFDGTVLTALREAETALATYGGELDRNVALTEARNQAQEALRIANLRFQIGSTSFLDTLDSQRTYVDTQAAVASSLASLASDQIDVFKALGGGWEQAPPVVQPPLPVKR